MNRKSFILHLDSLDVVKELTTEQKADLFQAIIDFNLGNEVNLSGLMNAVFIPFKNQFIRDNEKYNETVNRNKTNGLKGGRPKSEPNPQKPKKTQSVNSEPKKPDNDNKNDSVNDNVNVKVNDNTPEAQLKIAFDEFKLMRKKQKKEMTPHAEKLAKEKLKKLSGNDIQKAIDILNQSIMNGWQGVYELTPEKKFNAPSGKKPTENDVMDAAQRAIYNIYNS